MRFALSEEQKLLDNEFRRWLENDHDLDRMRDYCKISPTTRQERDKEFLNSYAEMGGTGVVLPEAYGGSQLGLLEAGLIAHRVGEVCYPVCSFSSIVASFVFAGDSVTMSPDFLQSIASGERHLAIGYSSSILSKLNIEKGSATGTLGMVNDPFIATDLLIVSGDEIYHADICNVSQEQLGKKELRTIDNTRSVGEFQCNNLPVKKLEINAAQIRQVLAFCQAAESLGVADAMLKKAVEWTLEREQFGQVIGSFQAVKHMCAEMAAAIEPCRAMMWYAGYAFDQSQDDAGYSIHLFQAHISDVGHEVARKATETHGGMGFTDLSGLHYWFKRIGLNRQWYGNAQSHRKIAASLQGL